MPLLQVRLKQNPNTMNKNKITIAGQEFELVPFITQPGEPATYGLRGINPTPSQPELYTIERLKTEKIAVRCVNINQLSAIKKAFNGFGDTDLITPYLPVLFFWREDINDWNWVEGKDSRYCGSLYTKTIPFSQVKFNDEKPCGEGAPKPEKDWEVTAVIRKAGIHKERILYYKDGKCYKRSDSPDGKYVNGTSSLETALRNTENAIHTVLRKTDNSEWSLEENARSVNNELPKPIESFRIDGNNMLVKLVGKSAEYNINNLSKPAKTLFGMKTAEEILKDVFGKTAYDAVQYKPLIRDAMKAYTSQYIDRCAEEAKLKSIAGVSPESFTNTFEVDRESILKIKSELK